MEQDLNFILISQANFLINVLHFHTHVLFKESGSKNMLCKLISTEFFIVPLNYAFTWVELKYYMYFCQTLHMHVLDR